METLKQRIITEIFERAMEGVYNAFNEVDNILQQSKEKEGLPEDAVIISDDNSMLLDIIEDKIIDAITETIDDMINDGDLTINEN